MLAATYTEEIIMSTNLIIIMIIFFNYLEVFSTDKEGLLLKEEFITET